MLKESHVIFICMEDIFGHGLPVYTFEDVCLENNAVKLGVPLSDILEMENEKHNET